MPAYRRLHVALALALVATAPSAFAQKMYKCADGKGGTVFQQSPCGETQAEADARAKERERLQAEEVRKKEEAERRKQEQIQKAKERDKAYLEQAEKDAAERKKAEGKGQGTPAAAAPMAPPPAAAANEDDSSLPTAISLTYPAPWREGRNAAIANALTASKIKGCTSFKYRVHSDGAQRPYLVRCTGAGAASDLYLMWPNTGTVSTVKP